MTQEKVYYSVLSKDDVVVLHEKHAKTLIYDSSHYSTTQRLFPPSVVWLLLHTRHFNKAVPLSQI